MGIFSRGKNKVKKQEADDVSARVAESAAITVSDPQDVVGNRMGKDVEDIPLDQRDHKRLSFNRYAEVSRKHQTTYVIQNTVFAPTLDRPNRFLRKTAELRAASAVHACNLVGWRPRSCRLVQVVEPDQRNVEVRVDGKVVGGMTVDSLIDQATAADRKEMEDAIRQVALDAQPVKDTLAKRKRIVRDVVVLPRIGVNVRTRLAPKVCPLVQAA